MPDPLNDNSSDSGENKLLKQLWVAYKDLLVKYCVQKFSSIDKNEASFIATEAIAILFRKLEKGEKIIEDHLAFLKGIISNIQKKQERNKNRRERREGIWADEIIDQTNKNPEEIYLNNERRELLKKIILQMDENCQKLLDLVLQGLNPIEIFKSLNHKSARVTSVILTRCRIKLAKLINPSDFI